MPLGFALWRCLTAKCVGDCFMFVTWSGKLCNVALRVYLVENQHKSINEQYGGFNTLYWLYGSFSCSTTGVHRGLYLMGMFFVFLTNAIIGDFSVCYGATVWGHFCLSLELCRFWGHFSLIKAWVGTDLWRNGFERLSSFFLLRQDLKQIQFQDFYKKWCH